jgi:hypothetical protein
MMAHPSCTWVADLAIVTGWLSSATGTLLVGCLLLTGLLEVRAHEKAEGDVPRLCVHPFP